MTRKVDANNQPIEEPDDVVLPAMGAVSAEKARQAALGQHTQEIEPVGDLAHFKDQAEALAFYEEELHVVILDSPDPNPEPYVFVAVNGRGPMPGPIGMSPWCPRNRPIKMARKYVEVLAQAKPINYRTIETLDSEGYKTTVLRGTTALRYPFQVLSDPNPRGPRWLAEMLRRR